MENPDVTERNFLLCGKCGGAGQYLRFGECFACRGSGVMCAYENGIITFQGVMYAPGTELKFYNTRSKINTAVVTRFYDKSLRYSQQDNSLAESGLIALNEVWFEYKAPTTGNPDQRPLYISLEIDNLIVKKKSTKP